MMDNSENNTAKIRPSTIVGLVFLGAIIFLTAFIVIKCNAKQKALNDQIAQSFFGASATEVPQGFVYGESNAMKLSKNCSAGITIERRDTSNDDLLFVSYSFSDATEEEEEECFAAFFIMLFRYFLTTQFEYVSIHGNRSDGSFFTVELSDWNKVEAASGGNSAFLQNAIDIYNGFDKSLAERRTRAAQYAEVLFTAIKWNGKKALVKAVPENLDRLTYLIVEYSR